MKNTWFLVATVSSSRWLRLKAVLDAFFGSKIVPEWHSELFNNSMHRSIDFEVDLGTIFGSTWAPFGLHLAPFGAHLGLIWPHLPPNGPHWASIRPLVAAVGPHLSRMWIPLGSIWAPLASIWAPFVPYWAHLGPNEARFEPQSSLLIMSWHVKCHVIMS